MRFLRERRHAHYMVEYFHTYFLHWQFCIKSKQDNATFVHSAGQCPLILFFFFLGLMGIKIIFVSLNIAKNIHLSTDSLYFYAYCRANKYKQLFTIHSKQLTHSTCCFFFFFYCRRIPAWICKLHTNGWEFESRGSLIPEPFCYEVTVLNPALQCHPSP